MPHSEKRHQEIKVSCKLFLQDCQGNRRAQVACPLQKVALCFYQTCKAWVGWEVRLKNRWKFIWGMPEEGLKPHSLSMGSNEFSWKRKVKWSGSIFEGIVPMGLVRREMWQEVKLWESYWIWIGFISLDPYPATLWRGKGSFRGKVPKVEWWQREWTQWRRWGAAWLGDYMWEKKGGKSQAVCGCLTKEPEAVWGQNF